MSHTKNLNEEGTCEFKVLINIESSNNAEAISEELRKFGKILSDKSLPSLWASDLAGIIRQG